MNAQGSFNTAIDVTAFYFSHGKELKTYPKRIEFNGTVYNLLEDGIRLLVKQGQEFVSLFNMSDGTKRFNLKFDPRTNDWTLISMKGL